MYKAPDKGFRVSIFKVPTELQKTVNLEKQYMNYIRDLSKKQKP